MGNLNAEQIINEIQSLIKALKDCGGWVKRGNGEGWFNHEILADALSIITSQEQRIKELTEELEATFGQYTTYQEAATQRMRKLTEENERLRKHCKPPIARNIDILKATVKADTVKEFAERLKVEKITLQDHTGKLGSVILVSTIDQIAKEMLEGKSNGSETCAVCGDVIPEGRQVCPNCEK